MPEIARARAPCMIDILRIAYYIARMIKSFSDRKAEALFDGKPYKRWKAYDSIAAAALRKLDMLAAAVTLDDLRALPGNQLEALSGDRKGQFSIRINDQWRICFVWEDGAAWEVEIVDYH